MSCLEDDLFYACTSYCDALNHYKCTREEMFFRKTFPYSDSEVEKVMNYEKDRVRYAMERLREILDKIDGDINGKETDEKRRS